jgi:hypothetical protein
VRKISHPLTAEQVSAVKRFAEDACRRDLSGSLESSPLQLLSSSEDPYKGHARNSHSSSDEEAIVLMAPAERAGVARFSCMPSAERFLTTHLIGEMLTAAGQVSAEGHTFIAATKNDRVLAPVQEIPPLEVARVRGGRAPAQRLAAQHITVDEEL